MPRITIIKPVEYDHHRKYAVDYNNHRKYSVEFHDLSNSIIDDIKILDSQAEILKYVHYNDIDVVNELSISYFDTLPEIADTNAWKTLCMSKVLMIMISSVFSRLSNQVIDRLYSDICHKFKMMILVMYDTCISVIETNKLHRIKNTDHEVHTGIICRYIMA